MKTPDSPQAVLQHYFDEMLTEDTSLATVAEPDFEAEVQREKLQKLLYSARVASVAADLEPAPVVASEEDIVTEVKTVVEIEPEEKTQEPVIDASADLLHEEPVRGSLQETLDEVVEPETAADVLAAQAAVEGLEWLDNGLPAWAQKRFDVLLFSVSGLTLAVPLIALGQIQPLTDELTPLFGQAEWFMGLQPTANGKIRTVNTAKFVMPERYDENFVKTARYVVSIDGVPWGLAVDAVNQPISLNPEDVKWRTERTKRPWLAGTVKEHMCALLDIPRIGQMLMDADRNSRGKSAGALN